MADEWKKKLEAFDEKTVRDIQAFLYALAIIRGETGHGTLDIEIRDGVIVEMRAAHQIKPKYLKVDV
jgi:hypothetical protein